MKKAFLACFVLVCVFSLSSFAGSSEDYYEGIFSINQDPVVLDIFEILSVKEKHQIDDRTMREIDKLFSSPRMQVLNMKASWWDTGTYRFDERESSRYSFDSHRESLLPAFIAEKVYGGRVDVGPAKVYMEKIHLPSLKIKGKVRLSFLWRRGPSLAIKMPW